MLCTEEGCDKEAEYTYIWPWGTDGACCSTHRLTLNQRATQQLDTVLHFTMIDPGRPVPVSRDERIGLRAKIMVLEEDVRERDGRIGMLAQAGTEHVDEIRRLRAIGSRLQEEVNAAHERLEQAERERDDARTAAGVAIQERDRLELLVRNVGSHPATTPPPG